MKKIFLFFFLLSFSLRIFANGAANGDIGIILSINGGSKTMYKVYSGWSMSCNSYDTSSATSFDGTSLGNVNSLILNGAAIVGWTDNSDWIAGKIEYKIWKTTDTEPSTITGEFIVGGYGSWCSATDVMCSSVNNRFVGKDDQSVNLLNGLTTGDYNIKIYSYGQLRYDCSNWGDVTHDAVTATFTIDTTTWDGSSWDHGVPSSGINAIINGDYPGTGTDASVVANNLTVNTGNTLTINSGYSVTVSGDISNEGTITVSDGGNFFQESTSTYDTGSTGTFNVEKGYNYPDVTNAYIYWGSPVADQAYSLLPFGSNQKLKYNEATDYFNLETLSTFTTGKGTAIYGKNISGTATFTGVPNNGSITSYSVTKNGSGYNLMANPYPSNLDLDILTSTNSSLLSGTFYFWTNENDNSAGQQGSTYGNDGTSNYATYVVGTGGTPATNNSIDPDTGVVSPTQGFIAEASAAGSLTFDNSMRVSSTSTDFFSKSINNSKTQKTSSILDRYWLRLTSPEGNFNTILIAYVDGAQNTLDNYDGKLATIGYDSFYSLADNNTTSELAIQGRTAPLTDTDMVPLVTKNYSSGTHTISLVKTEGVFSEGQAIYLLDKTTGTYTNLQSESYSYTENSGTITDRFEIVYETQTLSVSNNINNEKDFIIYKNSESFVLKAKDKIINIELYDTSGRLVKTLLPNATETEFSLSNSGIYIVKIKTEKGDFSKKIIN